MSLRHLSIIYSIIIFSLIGCAREPDLESQTEEGPTVGFSSTCTNGTLRCPELYDITFLKISADSVMPEIIEDKAAQEKFSATNFETNLTSYFKDVLSRDIDQALSQLIQGKSFKKFVKDQDLKLSKVYVVERNRDSLRTKLDGDIRAGGSKDGNNNSLLARLRILGVMSTFNVEAIFINGTTGESYTMFLGEVPVNVTLRQAGGQAKVDLGELVGSVLKVPGLKKIIEDYLLSVSMGASVEFGSLKTDSDADVAGKTYIFNRGSDRETTRSFSRLAEKLAAAFVRDVCEPYSGDRCDVKQDTTSTIANDIIEQIKILPITKCTEGSGGRYVYVKAPKVIRTGDAMNLYSPAGNTNPGYKKRDVSVKATVESLVTSSAQEICGITSSEAQNLGCYRLFLSNPSVWHPTETAVSCNIVSSSKLVLSPLSDELIQ